MKILVLWYVVYGVALLGVCFPTFESYVLPSVLMGKHIKRKQRERNEVI